LIEKSDEAKNLQKKFQKRRFLDFVFKFLSQYFLIFSIKVFKPLTLTLSPQVGRGDKGDDFFR
jgi:hypothetical protein